MPYFPALRFVDLLFLQSHADYCIHLTWNRLQS